MRAISTALLLLYCCRLSIQYSSFFNHWHCIGIKDKIDFSRPYKINIGDLPLVLWKDNKHDKLVSTINICKHMGSALDNGKITKQGCLQCQYHGLEMSYKDAFGETIEHEGKIFWAYKPIKKKPYSVPFYTNNNYETSILEIDMDCSLTDSAYNTMDIKHPEFVHNKLFGFGNVIPPENVRHYVFPDSRVGVSFDYSSNKLIETLNSGVKKTNNFHMYIYPTFSWSKVSFIKNNFIIGVNLLPIGRKKTRWFVTICHNYYKGDHGRKFIQMLATTILHQDRSQMKNQIEENDLKRAVIFSHIFKDENPIIELRAMFKDYIYPDIDECVKFYNDNIPQIIRK
jgi:phenylpropionate dioxygenase-like ring-hydroxylating dioxygenase large terminal subunit